MPDHYYTAEPTSAHRPAEARFAYRGHELVFATDSGVFSREGLDRGTRALLDALPDALSGDALDMGCGWGAIGVSLGKAWPGLRVTMTDINERACGLAKENAARNGVTARVAASDGYAALGGARYDLIVQNPPIRAGKAVIYAMFAEAARRLNAGGALWLVIRKQQGAPSAQRYLATLFEDVTIADRASGYWVFRCASPTGQIK